MFEAEKICQILNVDRSVLEYVPEAEFKICFTSEEFSKVFEYGDEPLDGKFIPN